MKKIDYIKIILFLGLILNYSCGKDTFSLDMTQNPNYLTEDQSDPDYLLNNAQVNFGKLVESFGKTGAEVTRIYHMSGRFYDAVYIPQSFDDEWRRSYAIILKDLQVMNKIAQSKNLTHHMAIGKVIKAYTLMTLVDFFGDIPNSNALDEENLFANPDSGADVYANAINLLNEAISEFQSNAAVDPQIDLFYGGDWNKWIKLANTLKMKAYITTRLVDNNALSNFESIMNSGDYIQSNDEDFQFTWGTNDVNPDSRHPRYANSYTSSGGQEYQSNSFMDYMTGPDPQAYLAMDHFDPRALFYFYRQVSETPGKDGAPDEQLLECSVIPAPPHYAGYTYCGVAKGWWGRDHGNDNGIPPDGFTRTLFGVYPAGGALDDLSYEAKKNEDGYKGAGITPIMLASWVKFMIAEYHLTKSSPDVAAAKTALFEGIDLSMEKVLNFKPKTARFNYIFSGNPGLLPTIDDYKNTFVSQLTADWDAGNMEDKWNILARQYFVALFGNGIDAYNFYRRTGYPHNLQPNLEPNPGPFIRSHWYPANSVSNNPNMNQKPGVATQVFWDNNPPSPGFPVSN